MEGWAETVFAALDMSSSDRWDGYEDAGFTA